MILKNDEKETSSKMLLNKFTLSFKDDNEKKFQMKYFQDSLIQFRVSFIIVIFLYGVFGFLDMMLAKEYIPSFHIIRYAVVIPFFLFTLVFSFHKNFSKIWQYLLFLCFIIGGAGIAIMTLLLPENYEYYAGLMLVFSAGYFFIKLRFTLASIAGWLTLLFFNIGAFSFSRIEPIMILFNNFFFISANIIGMFAAYYIEYYTRRDFFMNQQIDHRNAEILESNLSLETKVAERTRELIIAKEKAEEREKEFKQIIESQAEGIGFINQNEIFEFANSASEKIFEVNTGELIGRCLLDFLEKDNIEIIKQQNDKRIEGNINTYELKIKTKKNNTKYILVSATPKFDENNTYLGAYGVVRDITDRKLIELNFYQQLYFTRALNEIAEVIVGNDNANDLLEESNRIIGETLKLDRSLIYEISFEKKCIFGLCEWLKETHPDIEPTKDTYPLEMFLSPFTEIRNTQKYLISHFNDVNKIFEKDESAKTLHQHFKIKSLIWYPFAFSNQGYYLFTLNQILDKREWTTAEIGFIESAAKQLSLALLKIKLLDDRKKAEIQLKINEERFKNLFDYSLNGVRITNKEGIVIDQNPAMAEISGNKIENAIGKYVWDVIYNQAPINQRKPELYERIKKITLQILKDEKLPDERVSLVNELQHTDGSLRTVKSNYFIVKSDLETLYYTVIQDITELITAENELKKQIQLRQFLTEIASSYINLSIDDMELEINDSLAKIGRFVNTDRTYIFSFDARTEICSNTYEWCANGIEPQIDDLQKIPLGKDWIETFAKGEPIYVPDVSVLPEGYTKEILEPQGIKSCLAIPMMNQGECIGFVGFDSVNQHYKFSDTELQLLNLYTHMMVNIFLRKQNEMDLIEATQKAVESDKLKTAFLHNISHEIRTPFNGILGFLQFIQDDDISDEQKKEFFSIINHSSTRLINTINDIVDISQIQAGQAILKMTNVNLKIVLDNLNDYFVPLAHNKDIELKCNIDELNKKTEIKTDGDKLKSILSFLIDNAIKFTNKGSVEFGIISNIQTPDYINNSENKLCFFVKDTGVGIPKDKQTLIFEKFMQADVSDTRAYEGSGLGLSIAKAYVEMLDGSIWLESEVNKGSCFYFIIPLNPINEEITLFSNVISIKSIDKIKSELKILIVEDDLTSIDFIKIILRNNSNQLFVANSGNQAIELFKNNQDIDLILMDLKMPDMNGYEASKQIKLLKKDVIIIAQTAYALTGDREKAIEAGCNDYITKPINKDKLIKMINHYFKC